MDENNEKPYKDGWFGGTIIFGNTHIFFKGHPILKKTQGNKKALTVMQKKAVVTETIYVYI